MIRLLDAFYCHRKPLLRKVDDHLPNKERFQTFSTTLYLGMDWDGFTLILLRKFAEPHQNHFRVIRHIFDKY